MTLEEGQVIAGKYRIVRQLGQGGMGAVYSAVNERLRKEVALKILSDELASDPEQAERFVREAMVASACKHPGVVEIYDADTDEGVMWIAMEKLEGESLADRLAKGSLSVERVFAIMSQVASALSAVHAVGVIHRDLKPANVFLERLPSGEERVKILDFGIAKASLEGLDKLTRTGTTVGTPAYLAPEQAIGNKAIDHRTDVYAVGVILFEALSGTMPYEAQSFGEMVAKMVQEGPRNLATVAPQIPPAVAELVNSCLSVDADARPQSAKVLLDRIDALEKGGMAATMAGPRAVVPAVTPQQVVQAGPAPVAKTAVMPYATPPVDAQKVPAAVAVSPSPPSKAPILIGVAVAGVLVVGGAVAALATMSSDDEQAAGAASPPASAVPAEPPDTLAGSVDPQQTTQMAEPVPVAPEGEVGIDDDSPIDDPSVTLVERRPTRVFHSIRGERQDFTWRSNGGFDVDLLVRTPAETQDGMLRLAARHPGTRDRGSVLVSYDCPASGCEALAAARSDGRVLIRLETPASDEAPGDTWILLAEWRADLEQIDTRQRWRGTPAQYWGHEAPAWTEMRRRD